MTAGRTAGPPLAVAAVVALLGVPLGLAWAALAPDVPVRATAGGPVLAEPQGEQPVAADGWFVLLAAPFGVLVAGAAWRFLRRARGPGTVAAVAAGATIAGLLAWWVGRQPGLSAYEQAVAAASAGELLRQPPDLHMVASGWWPPVVQGAPLLPGLFAALTYTLAAAWSRYPELDPAADAGRSEDPEVGGPGRSEDPGG